MDILGIVAIGMMAVGGAGLVAHGISRPKQCARSSQAVKPKNEDEPQHIQETDFHPRGLHISYLANEDWKAKIAYLGTVPGSEEAENFRNPYSLRNL